MVETTPPRASLPRASSLVIAWQRGQYARQQLRLGLLGQSPTAAQQNRRRNRASRNWVAGVMSPRLPTHRNEAGRGNPAVYPASAAMQILVVNRAILQNANCLMAGHQPPLWKRGWRAGAGARCAHSPAQVRAP